MGGEGKPDEQPSLKRKIDLDFSYQHYKMMRKAFHSAFSENDYSLLKPPSQQPELHKLGQVVWECSINDMDAKNDVKPPPIDDPFYSQVQKLLPQISGVPFYCYSTTAPPSYFDPNSFMLEVKNDENQWVSVGTLGNLDISSLKKHAKPSPFGDLTKMATVYDKTVRDAWEIKEFQFLVQQTQQLLFGWAPPQPPPPVPIDLFSGVVRDIAHKLELKKKIRLTPHKINIYEEGGFFKATDTPEDPEKTIGSVVVTLPSPYTGGEFVITHGGEQHKFPYCGFTWIAFFGDCLHEVLPVTSGTRITVTYLMDVEGEDDEEEEEYYEGHFSRNLQVSPHVVNPIKQEKALAELVEVLKSIKKPATGFILDHKYTHSALELGILKGPDQIIADRLRKEGFALKLQSVLFKNHIIVPESQDGRPSQSKKSVYSWTEDDLQYVLGKGSKPDHVLKDIPFFRIGALGEIMDEHEIEGAEHTGNQCRDSEYQTLFWNAALIAEKPTWWTFTRLLWIAKKKNLPTDCPLGNLPADVIRHIGSYLRAEDENNNAPDPPPQNQSDNNNNAAALPVQYLPQQLMFPQMMLQQMVFPPQAMQNFNQNYNFANWEDED